VAVCVKGLDFPPDEHLAPRLLEWAEANRLLGATRLRLYWRRPPTQPAVRRALRHLRRGGDVDVLESLHGRRGRTPDEPQLDLWQRRRLDVLDLTDCLYRSVGRHQFVLSLDIDEV
jgi:Glycosyltransferase family 92